MTAFRRFFVTLSRRDAMLLLASVPFARGTPPWRRHSCRRPAAILSFSPLREGDTSVASPSCSSTSSTTEFQSPSRGGHLRGLFTMNMEGTNYTVSVPFARGTPPWLRGGELEEFNLFVSVPFARGTPPWPRWAGDATLELMFQSPSRGGHLRGDADVQLGAGGLQFQSPSRGGHLRGDSAYV